MQLTIPKEELISPGHMACPGCSAPLALRYSLKALGKKTVVTMPPGCWAAFVGPFPHSALKIPFYHTTFESAAAAASGIKAGLEKMGKDWTVLAWAGDGGTFDIGIQALSGAAERDDDIIYVCYDNEAYMNTGIQRSSATPPGAWTTTTPEKHPKDRPKKDMIKIMAAHRIPYAATASVGYPEDLINKMEKAKNIKGTKFIHILSPCPPGWKMPPEMSLEASRLAVDTKVFPLYEIEKGEKYIINKEPAEKLVEDYLQIQGRFRHLSEDDIRAIQESVDTEWKRLEKLASQKN